jgi:hypothetical protein
MSKNIHSADSPRVSSAVGAAVDKPAAEPRFIDSPEYRRLTNG